MRPYTLGSCRYTSHLPSGLKRTDLGGRTQQVYSCSRKPISVRLNSAGFSRYMMCPTPSTTTRRELAIPASMAPACACTSGMSALPQGSASVRESRAGGGGLVSVAAESPGASCPAGSRRATRTVDGVPCSFPGAIRYLSFDQTLMAPLTSPLSRRVKASAPRSRKCREYGMPLTTGPTAPTGERSQDEQA